MAYAAADVRINYPVHFRVGDQRDRLLDVFQESIPRKLRRAHKVGRIQLVLLQGVVSENLKRVGQQADVAQKVELHLIIKVLTLKVCQHVLGVGVVGLRTLHAYELVEEGRS